MMFDIDEIYSVSDFLSRCNKTLENNIPTCWLQGEISNLSRPASGHWYFSLKDAKAQINCALFRLNQRQVRFNLENGMAVLVHATTTLYEVKGSFQLIIEHIEPMGVGNLQLAFEQLKNKLKIEGLFDSAHKQPLPQQIDTIGVISSRSGAVIQDIIKVLNKRYPFAHILLFDCVVQGDTAAQKLANAVVAADQSKLCDVLILARGGGSLEDLWAFNEEILARAIFNAKTPIVSAIGHETDTTIADFVSDSSAPTPTAAAVLVSRDRLELLSNAAQLQNQLFYLSRQKISFYQQQLSQLQAKINLPERQLNFFSQRLDGITSNLKYKLQMLMKLNNTKLMRLFAMLKQHSPIATIQHKKDINKNWHNRLKIAIQAINNAQTQQLNSSAASLDLLSPLNTLSRGYSITTLDDKVLLTSKNSKINDSIITQLADGKIYAKIDKIQNN